MRAQETMLFGGAITCHIPQKMQDVSAFRQVPDNQEVFNEINTGTTIIIELLARQAQVSDDDAAKFFFADLAKDNGCSQQQQMVHTMARLPPSAYPHVAQLPPSRDASSGCVCSYGGIATGVQTIAKFSNEKGKENDVFVGLVVLRFLPLVSTDILISVSAPQRVHPESSDAQTVQSIRAAEELTQTLYALVESFEVKDWDLFIQEE